MLEEKIVRCRECSSGCYCSDSCVTNHRSEHETLCGMIQKLEEIEVAKVYQELKMMEAVSRGGTIDNKEIVRLVGDRPLVQVCLGGVSVKGLWDTGSQISMISKMFLNDFLPNVKLHTVQEFLGGKKLSISAANNSQVPIEGIVLIDFVLDGVKFPVPFLVTQGNMDNPIIGSNVMKHLAQKCSSAVPSLMQLLPSLSEDNAELLVSALQVQAQQSDMLSDVKLTSDLVIPGNHMMQVKGKTRVALGVEERDALFSPAAEFLGEHELVVYESAAHLKRGKSQFINVAVYNPTSEEMFLKKGTVLGCVSEVNTIIQFPAEEEKKAKVESVEVEEDEEDEESWEDCFDLSGLSEEEFEEAKQMLLEEHEIFSKSKNDIGHVPDFKISLNLSDNTPVNESYRSIPRPLYEDVKNHINNLLAHGWVRKSTSPYASPMVCARKKDGSLRLCIDFRRLNAKIIPDRQPIPRVQDILDGLKGQEWFSTLDMSQAYHQGEISEESRKFTAFSTPWSLLEWVRIPYGLSNAPPCFQRFINETLNTLKDKICVAYLDDILIYGRNFKEHKKNVRTVLRCLRKKGIKLNPKKCCFFRKEVRYLGRLISKDGYRPDPENSEALDECLKPPNTVGKLRSLLGFLGYYRNFVMDFSRKMKPVYDLLKVGEGSKDKKALSRKTIKWLPEHQKLVEEVVSYLKSPEVIAFPDFNEPFFIHCDASNMGLGGVLYQKQDEKLRVISFASRTLSPAEINYNLHSGKLEFLALKWCVTEKFSDYLHYGPRFTVFTDNNPLTYVLSSAKLNAAGLRWVSQLADYQFDIKYRPGKLNIDADYLSRHPVDVFKSRMETNNEVLKAEDIGIIFSEAAKKKRACAETNIMRAVVEENKLEHNNQRITRDELSSAQMMDDIISPVYNAVVAGNNASADEGTNRGTVLLNRQRRKLSIEDGVLFRKTATSKQIVLPKVYHSKVFRDLHNNMGHLGAERVVELARKRFYWPYMQKDIEYYVRKQCCCLKDKQPNQLDRAPLVPISTSHPFELVSIDFVMLDPCKGGYQYGLVVCDHFTRFAQVYPTKNKSGKQAAECIFNNFILQYGLPHRIHHDQGTEFNNRLWSRLHQLTGVAASRTTPYHPEGDGQPERFNRTLISMLKCLGQSEKQEWNKHLSKLCFAYNSTVHKSTGFSPFYLMFGREARLPLDYVFGIDLEETNVVGQRTYDEYVKKWDESMRQAVEIAKKNVSAGQTWNKNAYDKKIKGVQIVEGDKVLLRNRQKGGTGKLRSFWEDSIYSVITVDEKIPVLTVCKEGGKPKRIHRNNVMLCNDLFDFEEKHKQPTTPTTTPKSIPKHTTPKQPQRITTPKPTRRSKQTTNTPLHQQTSTNTPQHQQTPTTQHQQLLNDTSVVRAPKPTSTKSPYPLVVNYSSSDDSDSDEMVLIFKEGEGARDEDFSIETSEGEQSEESTPVSGANDEVESVIEGDQDVTLPYEIEEALADVSDNEDVEVENGSQEEYFSDISIEPESVQDEVVSYTEEDSVSDDSVGSDAGYVRRSVRVSRPPSRYSP